MDLKLNLPKHAQQKQMCGNLANLRESMLREIIELFKGPTEKIMAAYTIKLLAAFRGNANPYDRHEHLGDSDCLILIGYHEAKKKHPILSKGLCLDDELGGPFKARGILGSTKSNEQGVGMIFNLVN